MANLLHLANRGLGEGVGRIGCGFLHVNLGEDVGPAVVDQSLLDLTTRKQDREIVAALARPARLERLEPVGIGRAVAARVDGAWRALEDVEMSGRLLEPGDELNRGRSGADQANLLVGEVGHSVILVAAGIGEVPAAGVEAVPLEAFDAGDARQLRIDDESGCADQEARRDLVAAIGFDDPPPARLVPASVVDHRLEQGALVKIVMSGDPLAMFANFVAWRIFL